MQSFANHMLKESAIDAAKAKLKKIKKGSEVSFTHQQSGEKISGQYKGLKRMGAHSYAHIETGKGAYRVPVHHVHQAQ